MTDHANELRRYAPLLGRPAIMLDAADEIKQLAARLEAAEKESDALRAEIEAMERQEPVAFALYSGWACKAVYLREIEACEQRDRRQLTADLGGSLEAYRVVPLYPAPGAQGKEK